MTAAGTKRIADLVVGDLVLAYNEETGQIEVHPILDTLSHVDPQIVLLTVDGETLETTAEHPFYEMASAPWLAVGQLQGRWTDAGDLEVGDRVWQADGTTGVVEAVETVAVEQRMYNLTVDVAHTFFVGEGRWLVHNCISWKGFQKGKLQEHYQKHVLDQGEFGNISQNEYLRRAKDFAQETSTSFQEAEIGNLYVKYDPVTGRVFVGHTKSRQIRTFYIDDGRAADPFQAAVNFAEDLVGN